MLLGADPTQLQELADHVHKTIRRLETATASIGRASGLAWWHGPDADQFRRRWATTHHAQAHQTTEVLHGLLRHLRDQAREQERASTVAAPAAGAVVAPAGPAAARPTTAVPTAGVPSTGQPAGTWVDDRQTHLGFHRQSTSSGSVGPIAWQQHREVSAGAGAEHRVEATWGGNGVDLTGTGGVHLGFTAQSTTTATGLGMTLSQEQEAVVGAAAGYEGSLHLGRDGLRAEAEVEAFAGASATSTVRFEGHGVKTSTGAGLSWGVGGSASWNGGISTREIRLGAEFELAALIGANVNVDLTIRPGEVLDSLGDLAQEAPGKAVELVGDFYHFLGG